MSNLALIFQALNRAGSRYVVAGGVAVVLHGYARMTLDLDLVVDLAPGEARKTIEALTRLGLVPRVPVDAFEFVDPAARLRWITERNMTVFSFVDPEDPMRIVDLFVEPPIPFTELWARSETIVISGEPVRVASIDDLIQMKTVSDRAQDREDIEALEAIREERSRRARE